MGRRTGGVPGSRARPPGSGRAAGGGASSAPPARPRPAPPPGLAAPRASDDAVTQPRGRGWGRADPARWRPRPGPGPLCQQPEVQEGLAAGATVPGWRRAFVAPGESGGAHTVQLTCRRARGSPVSGAGSAGVRSGLAHVLLALGPPWKGDRGQARRPGGCRAGSPPRTGWELRGSITCEAAPNPASN